MSIPAYAPAPISSLIPSRLSPPVSVTVSVPAPIPISPHTPSYLSSPVSVTVSVTMDPSPIRNVSSQFFPNQGVCPQRSGSISNYDIPSPSTVIQQPNLGDLDPLWQRIRAIRASFEETEAIGESYRAQGFETARQAVNAPLQSIWQPPSLEEFLANIERRRFQPVLYKCSDMCHGPNSCASVPVI
jgi:hypothetical protein